MTQRETLDRNWTLDRLPEHPGQACGAWNALHVDGQVARPLRLTLDDLSGVRATQVTDDFHCEEGWTAPGQRWEGVTLASVLRLAGPLPCARYAWISSNGFSVSIPLDDAALPGVILAMSLNGRPLAPIHGGPCRLVTPGLECYHSVKRVTRIRLTVEPQEASGQEIALARIGRPLSPWRPPQG